jgi:hypothetical protein
MEVDYSLSIRNELLGSTGNVTASLAFLSIKCKINILWNDSPWFRGKISLEVQYLTPCSQKLTANS